MQSYNPGLLRWGFLRLLLRLQLGSLNTSVASSYLEKDERLILWHVCIYSWKRHALCYAVLGYARTRWLNTLYGIVWETKYGRFTNGNVQSFKHTCFAFELFAMNATPARRVTPPWDVYMANCHPGWQGYPTWQTVQPALAGYPTYHEDVIKIKWEIIRKGDLGSPTSR